MSESKTEQSAIEVSEHPEVSENVFRAVNSKENTVIDTDIERKDNVLGGGVERETKIFSEYDSESVTEEHRSETEEDADATECEGERLSENSDEIFNDSPDESFAFTDEDAELERIRAISGRDYRSLTQLEGGERYLELRKSGILTAEEAYYAVTHGKSNAAAARADASGVIENGKSHLAPSVIKRSTGEVFSRADREELAKWGIAATGSQLERMWRNAGKA
ncbi:MAG: hypothetical protein IJY04_04610 [Clostridia bacterium]|nr:hypothetical protein [Clostridia bacterium]